MNRENVLLAIASLFIAVLMWLQVQPLYEPGREREFAVPITFENKPETLVAFPAIESVIVVASGTLADLDQLDTNTVQAVVDLSTAQAGDRNFLVQVRAPANSRLEFRPRDPRARVALEPVVTRTLPVEVTTANAPLGGLAFTSASTQPAEVRVTGPKSYMERVATARVTIDLAAVRPGLTFSIPVQVLDQEAKPVPLAVAEPTEVIVAPAVAAAAVEREVPVIADVTGTPASGYRVVSVTVSPNSIKLTGPTDQLAGVTSLRVPSIDVSQANESVTRTLRPNLPPGTSTETPIVTVTVTIRRQ